MELSLTVGNENASSLETAFVIASLSNLVMWFFFILVTVIVYKYIKEKNARPRKGKHS